MFNLTTKIRNFKQKLNQLDIQRSKSRNENDQEIQNDDSDETNDDSFFIYISLITLLIATVGLIFTSDYFEAKLPTKVSFNDLNRYENPSSQIDNIYDITLNGTIKVIEPALYIDESRASIDLIVYEYYNNTDDFGNGEDREEIYTYATGLTYLQELEYPGLNYFGFNSELYFDLENFFEETIYSLYFDEVALEFEPAMDLNGLITWLRVKNVLSFFLMLIGLTYLGIGTLMISTSSTPQYNKVKRFGLIGTTCVLSLILVGYITVYSLINSLFASAINGFNLAASIIIFIWSIIINSCLIV